ncbi:MAG: FkbM family methyltransferase [Planctomycetota bacterium]
MTTLNSISPPTRSEDYNGHQPSMMKLASWLNRVAPRGKGAIPRWIGKQFGRGWKTTVRTDSGCRLAVDPANLDLFVTIENEGSWEPWIRRVCQLAMKDGGVMFDVGANAGAISNETALACPNITIKAFEPQTELAELVTVSAAINGLDNIEVFPVAVGDHEGTVQLHKPAHALHASLATSGETNEAVVDVPLITLDGVVASGQLPPPCFIKIDVEGGELGVLQGAKQILKEHYPTLIFEANESADRFGYTRDELLSLISSANDYVFFSIAPGDVLASPRPHAERFAKHYAALGS